MALASTANADASEIRVTLPERFDFSLHRDFRRLYEEGTPAVTRYVIDMRNTQYVDSAALGMLLQLWEHAGKKSERVHIVNVKPGVQDILQIANFQQLMQVG